MPRRNRQWHDSVLQDLYAPSMPSSTTSLHRAYTTHPTHPYALLDHIVCIRLQLDLQFRPLRYVLFGHLVDPGGIHDHDIPRGRQSLALGQRRRARVCRQGCLDEQRIAKTVDVVECEFECLWGDGGTGRGDDEESVDGGPTCAMC